MAVVGSMKCHYIRSVPLINGTGSRDLSAIFRVMLFATVLFRITAQCECRTVLEYGAAPIIPVLQSAEWVPLARLVNGWTNSRYGSHPVRY